MPKMMLHNREARRALARGVAAPAAAVEPTLGPKGMNAMIDRPIGTPMVTRDGVTIATEIELPDRFENMGAQVVREVSMQTNEVAGDGTTTAIVLANAWCRRASRRTKAAPRRSTSAAASTSRWQRGRGAQGLGQAGQGQPRILAAVANIAATEPSSARWWRKPISGSAREGVITTEFSVTTETALDVVEGMSFDRGYLSHHMVTDQEKMEAVLDGR